MSSSKLLMIPLFLLLVLPNSINAGTCVTDGFTEIGSGGAEGSYKCSDGSWNYDGTAGAVGSGCENFCLALLLSPVETVNCQVECSCCCDPNNCRCPENINNCRYFENVDGTNYCSQADECDNSTHIWEPIVGGLGCNGGLDTPGNDPSCGCCVKKQVPDTCPEEINNCKFYENPDGTNFCSPEDNCDTTTHTWEPLPDGLGCGGAPDTPGNDASCGCCVKKQVPDTCPEEINNCKFYENSAGTNFCGLEEDCNNETHIWNPLPDGLGCDGAPDTPGNNDACGCCVLKQVPDTCPEDINNCRFYENTDGTNFCSPEDNCDTTTHVWEPLPDGLGCGGAPDTPGNDASCGCCVKLTSTSDSSAVMGGITTLVFVALNYFFHL